MRHTPMRDPAATLELASLLAHLVCELNDTATRCTALQWSIASLLDKVHHPDLAEEIHMLQDIDRLQQTLLDIAAVLQVASEIPDEIALSRDAVAMAIKLESFRGRIGLGSPLDADASCSFGDESGITWL